MDATAVTFLVIGAIGVAVLLLSLFVGEIGELGGVEIGDGDADGPFSVPAIAALLGGVGFGGAAASSLLPGSLPGATAVLLSLAIGGAVAVPLAWGAVRLSRSLQDMPTQPTLTRHHLLGARGVVVSAVPAAGLGEVRLFLAGQQLKYSARSDVPLSAGTPVYVVEALSETSVQVVSTALDDTSQTPPEPGGTTP